MTPITTGVISGIAGAVILTLDEPVSGAKLLKIARGAVVGGLAGLLMGNVVNRNDPRKW